MMKAFKLFSIFFLLTSALIAKEEPSAFRLSMSTEGAPFPMVNLEGEPSSVVAGCVNVISGDYFDFESDLSIPGTLPLDVERSYSSSDTTQGAFSYAWHSNFQGGISWAGTEEKSLSLKGLHGSELHYDKKKHAGGKYFVKEEHFKKGITNNSSGIISGRTNINNCYLKPKSPGKHFVTLYRGDGSEEHYQEFPKSGYLGYLLKNEQKASGLQLAYHHNPYGLVDAVAVANPAGKNMQFFNLNYDVNHNGDLKIDIIANDKRKVRYNFKRFKYHVREGHLKNHYFRFLLSEVSRPNSPKVRYSYEKINGFERVVCKKLPRGRFTKINYYKKGSYGSVKIGNHHHWLGRVESIENPYGRTYQFDYHIPNGPRGAGSCGVYDAYQTKTIYSWDEELRLKEVIRCRRNGEPYTFDKLFWGKEGTHLHGNLLSRVYYEGGLPLFCRCLGYDHHGNVLVDYLYGNLTGTDPWKLYVDPNGYPINNGVEAHVKTYTYYTHGEDLNEAENGGKNLLRTETEGLTTKEYVYYPGTDLIGIIFTKINGSQIVKRQIFVYDEDRALTVEYIDNGCDRNPDSLLGVSYRKMKRITSSKQAPFGMPLMVEEFCLDVSRGEYLLEKNTVNTYTREGFLTSQQVFDSNNQPAYTLIWNYDSHGNIISEYDALGQEVLRQYDENDNLILERGPRKDFEKKYEYNALNQLTKIVENHAENSLSTYFFYDLMGRKIQEIDHFGNVTEFEHDDFGRVITVKGPIVEDENGIPRQKITRQEFDGLGNIIRKVDALDRVTEISYTIRGQPYDIRYLDGTREMFYYLPHGPMFWHRERNGCHQTHTLDYADRIIKTEYKSEGGELLYTTSAVYDTFNLLEETDAMGCKTTYTYDAFGRKKSEASGTRLATYDYDTLGRVSQEKIYYGYKESEVIVRYYQYDLLNRLIEERTEDYFGTVFDKKAYSYDEEGHQIEAATFSAEGERESHLTLYNSYGTVREVRDPLGNATTSRIDFNYVNALGQPVFCEKTIDPLGITTILIKDTLGRQKELVKLNLFQQEIQRCTFFYDLAGNQCKIVETVYAGEKSPQTQASRWEYDAGDRLISFTESFGSEEEKTTRYSYDSFGQLTEILKPSGIKLTHTYSKAGLLESLCSSDNSICYTFTYNANGNLILSEDPNFSINTIRNYNGNGELVREVLHTGLSLCYSYDRAGRISSLKLPDNSAIAYAYQGPVLKKISRLSPLGDELYVHHFECFDLSLNPISETLIHRVGKLKTAFDANKRVLSSISDHAEEIVPAGGYDGCGNLRQRTLLDPVGLTHFDYSYDDLYQLTSELGSVSNNYTYDSIYNRLSKDGKPVTVNSLNQVLETEEESFTFDADGNPISCITPSGEIFYSYDALDRLTSVTNHGKTTRYAYDSFNRRLIKKADREKYFLYQDANEIGCLEESYLTEFRVLGDQGLAAEIGCAVAIELQGIAYAPIHDLSGNIIALIDSKGHPYETYRYSSFGEEQIFDASHERLKTAQNSWRFSSKRFDDESGLIYFGRRYYSPSLGRWLTQDPEGFDVSSNLYAYVSNNPLTHFDAYGLFEMDYALPGNMIDYKSVGESLTNLSFAAGNYAFNKITNTVDRLANNRVARNLGGWMILEDFPEYRNEHIDFLKNSYGSRSLAQNLISDSMDAVDILSIGYSGPINYLAGEVLPFASFSQKGVLSRLAKGSATLARPAAKTLAEKQFQKAQKVCFSRSCSAESVNAGVNLKRKLSEISNAQKFSTNTRVLSDGRIRYYKIERSSNSFGATRGAAYVTEYSPRSGRVRGWNECYNQLGKVDRIHPKNINGQLLYSQHYPLTLKEH